MESNDTDYIFGLAGTAALGALVAETALNLRFHHAMSSEPKHAHLCELRLPGRQLEAAAQGRRPARVLGCSRERTACVRRSTSATSSPRSRARRGTFTKTLDRQRGQQPAEPDQAAQGAVGVGSNVVPQRDRAIRCALFFTPPHSG